MTDHAVIGTAQCKGCRYCEPCCCNTAAAGPSWLALGPADFDAHKADKRAVRQARRDAEQGQAGLFHVNTPARETAPAPARDELPGQFDLFSEGN